jgi:hypothetical protein
MTTTFDASPIANTIGRNVVRQQHEQQIQQRFPLNLLLLMTTPQRATGAKNTSASGAKMMMPISIRKRLKYNQMNLHTELAGFASVNYCPEQPNGL